MDKKVKRLGLNLAVFGVLSLGGVSGQEIVRIKGVKFTEALVAKWVSEYSKKYHDIQHVTEKEGGVYSVEVSPFGEQREKDAPETGETVIHFGRYAVLPIAGTDNVLLSEVGKKKLNGKRLKALFFEKDYLSGEEEENEKGKLSGATVYSNNDSKSITHSFAAHFGYEASSLKGKRIAGDDIYLNSAVTKDATGFSFNNLSYLYDIESRRLREGLTLIPLDVKKEEAEVLNTHNLDETIALLERKTVDLIPVEDLVFVLPEKTDAATLRFVKWVLTEGQEYIHTFGFLRLDSQILAQEEKQLSALETHFLANK
jgi:ABC-type phosphate transport system substrate-binding protein